MEIEKGGEKKERLVSHHMYPKNNKLYSKAISKDEGTYDWSLFWVNIMNITQIWLASVSELTDMEITDTSSTAQLDNNSIRSIIFYPII